MNRRYWLNTPIVAIRTSAPEVHAAVVVLPRGTEIQLPAGSLSHPAIISNERFLEVTWEGTSYSIFRLDLQHCGEPMDDLA